MAPAGTTESDRPDLPLLDTLGLLGGLPLNGAGLPSADAADVSTVTGGVPIVQDDVVHVLPPALRPTASDAVDGSALTGDDGVDQSADMFQVLPASGTEGDGDLPILGSLPLLGGGLPLVGGGLPLADGGLPVVDGGLPLAGGGLPLGGGGLPVAGNLLDSAASQPLRGNLVPIPGGAAIPLGGAGAAERPVADDAPAESLPLAGGLPIFDDLTGALTGGRPGGLPAGVPANLPLDSSFVWTLPGLAAPRATERPIADGPDAFGSDAPGESAQEGLAGLPVPFLGTPSVDPSALGELPIFGQLLRALS
jgi:hypothetical protein